MPSNSLTVTAYHEAGHAVAFWKLGFKLRKVTIVPDRDYAGYAEAKGIRSFVELESAIRA